VFKGRIWILVLIVTATAPSISHWMIKPRSWFFIWTTGWFFTIQGGIPFFDFLSKQDRSVDLSCLFYQFSKTRTFDSPLSP
jgi:hypothetical protein